MRPAEDMLKTFEGRLTLDHMATHVPHRFHVPEATETLRFNFAIAPDHPGVGDIPHQMSISVYGPDGARGTRHNNADQAPVISGDWASPGYLPGPIEAGEWTVEIDVHRILPPGDVAYRIEVVAEETAESAPAISEIAEPSRQKRRGPGWYTGDLHGHTFHSDGVLSPEEYLELAHERGYDFVALTDHNTVSAVPTLTRLAAEGMTILAGEELTTFNGHAVALGIDGWREWRVKDGATMSGLAHDLQHEGAVYVIAHPRSEGHPFCTGCRWAYADMLPGPARHVEVWNSAWSRHNQEAVLLFYRWLNNGHRLVATSGTDTHRRVPAGTRIAANRVHAMDNTQDEILAALRAGHSYVTAGPVLSFTATADGASAEMGDIIAPGALRLACGWQPGPDANGIDDLEAHLIRRGEAIDRWACSERAEATREVTAQASDWFVLELRDRNGDLYGLTNPVFVGRDGEDWS